MAAPPPPTAAAAGTHSVFVYGTLMAEEVVKVLLGRAPPSSPALLPGHRRFSIRGRVYPAILPVPGHSVNGKVFEGLTDRELHVFDLFEDEEYLKKTVEVSLTDTSEKLLAYAYIWANESDPDLYGEWDYEEWRKVHLKDYLVMTQEFLDEVGQFQDVFRLVSWDNFTEAALYCSRGNDVMLGIGKRGKLNRPLDKSSLVCKQYLCKD